MLDISETEETFCYKFRTCNNETDLKIPVRIPFTENIEEYVQRIISMFKLPSYITNELQETLTMFINESTRMYYNMKIDNLIINAKKSLGDTTEKWDVAFREGNSLYCEHAGESDEEVFAIAYHKLVHSSALEAMLQVEHTYAQSVQNCTRLQDSQINVLTSKLTNEMAEAVEGLGVTTSEENINELAIQHFEDHSLLQAKWSSELNTMKEVQRREYRNWVMEMLEDQTKTLSPPSSPLMTSSPTSANSEEHFSGFNGLDEEESTLEESFTIHLGSQLKQMHNIRLLSANVIDYCKVNKDMWSSTHTPQRLQTAMSLYSNDLCGLVLLTDNIVGFSNMTKEFVKTCQQSTEFHFPHIDDQMENLSESVQKASVHRIQNILAQKQNEDWQKTLKRHLRCGDTFITRHSNLDKVHLVFHLIVDDSLRSNDINSRHPVILGFRNILKLACSNNITTLTVPLLLQHDMSEEMTVQWCTKRAELVFKCVKGFMIEMASWGGSELKNLQFLVPKGISSSVFSTLATMLPSIFKLSNPLVFKAIHSKQLPEGK